MKALKILMKTSGVAALAAGLVLVAMPSTAMAEPGDRGRGNWQGNGGGGERGNGGNGGGWSQRQQPVQQQQAVQPRPQVEARSQVQAAPQARNWNGGGQQANAGWQARAAQGGHYGRDWNNGGVVNRPAAAQNGQTATPGRNGWQQRNPTYSDPSRSRDYGANRGDNRGDNRQGDRQANQGRPESWQRGGNDWRDNDHRNNNDRARTQQGWNGQRWNGQNWDRRTDNRGNWQRDRNWQNNRNGGWNGNRNSNWNHDWRRDNRYNWSGWRNDHRDIFRMGRYHAPYRDWSYRRLSIGFFLQSGFYGNNYWIDDPWSYRLPPAYGPYRWVRYYDDAILVNIYDGEVVDVIYDFFW